MSESKRKIFGVVQFMLCYTVTSVKYHPFGRLLKAGEWQRHRQSGNVINATIADMVMVMVMVIGDWNMDQCSSIQRVGTPVEVPRDNKTRDDRTVGHHSGYRRVGNIKT